MSDTIVRLNVGGAFYDTTQETLYGSDFFHGLLKNKNLMTKGVIDGRYFIDRSGIIFEHVLNLLRNPTYLYPEKYLGELDFYLIAPPKNVEFSNNTVIHELSRLKKRVNKLRKCHYNSCNYCPLKIFDIAKDMGFLLKMQNEAKILN